MALDETFRFQPKIDEKVVFELTGEARERRELQPSRFEGPVADWAEKRMRDLGETIVPRLVYSVPTKSGNHKVAWVYHDGFEISTGEGYCLHHIACDCSSEIEAAESDEQKQEIIGDCKALSQVLGTRADMISSTYGIDTVLNAYYDPERTAGEQSPEMQEFALRSIVYVLEHDYRHPESWMANVESGWTLVNLMASIMHMRPEDIGWYADMLQENEVVATDGVAISLSQKLKDTIDAERILREVSLGFEEELAA